ncbi:MAG: phosphoglucosamine mutase [Gemmatimonadales bacterium]|nr:phosphoglucosamine mutase [Gemmatimonadales bacterium]
MSNSLIVSVSGMRGIVGLDLTPELVARHAAALGAWARAAGNPTVVVGRDARTSGPMFVRAASAGLMSVGVQILDVGLVPTPTVQLAVEHHQAGAGLVLTASHNPIEWNALKFIGPDGLFLDAEVGARVRELADLGPERVAWDQVGEVVEDTEAVARHLDQVMALPVIDVPAIQRRGFTVALDCVRGAGGTAMPALLERLGCTVVGINLETDGKFPRPPEPIPEHLGELERLVLRSKADVGVAVDPDVDRLALVDELGRAIGEDYTLAFAVQAVYGSAPSDMENARVVVANLSTSLVVEDAAKGSGARMVRAPVGEANVAQAIVEEGAAIGGEGNGGVILPSLHVGRDAPVGVALILHLLARQGSTVSALVAAGPRYHIVKSKLARGPSLEPVYRRLIDRFVDATSDLRDGLRLAWPDRWLHLRPSGTEPVVRIIAEAPSQAEAEDLVTLCRETLQ